MRGPVSNRKLILAAVLIILGVVAFAYEGLLYATRRGDVVREVPLPPILGAVALVGGLAVTFVSTQSVYRPPAPR